MFQPRARAGSKLTTVLDSEGREIQAESRKDEEQDIKLEETIDLLLAAGYFRARIKGLSAFDKVVGGMTWCIVTCNFDVDVDLLFQENSTIGQKISLTEKIVAVLPKMKCPHRIEPHQIQGMDFIHIFPVVQWLVKKAIATREEMGDMNRQFSISQFNKYHTLPEDDEFIKNTSTAVPIINSVRKRFGPRRKFRRLGDHHNEDDSTRVQFTLLEYGRRYGYSSKSSEEKNSDSKSAAPSTETHQQINQQEEKKISALMKSMIQTEDKQHRPSAAVVGSMVTLQSEEIKQAQAEYTKKQTEFESQIEKPGTLRYQKKIEQNLRKQLESLKVKQMSLETEYEEKKSQYVQIHDKLTELESLEEQIDTEMNKLDDLESGENKAILEKLRSLVVINDSHKKKEQEFKTKCKEELSALESSISELEETSGGITPEDEERNRAIESQHETETNKMKKLRLALAKKNRDISSLQRKIDEVPTRSELSQYQSRFIELYNQVSATHKETKQFYTLYNTLENSKLWLEKEIDLLNSIYDNFQRGMSSQANKEQFLKQIEHIVQGIKQNRAKLEKQKESEKMKRDLLNDKYLDLLEKQRIYFKTVKDLKEELKKNEMLAAKLSEYEQ